jgi:hypothetical protein
MRELLYRLLFMVWFLAYMSAIYLALHMVVARFVRRADNRVLWFFSVITGPLTRPVRVLLPVRTPEPRVRLVTLIVLVAVWFATRMALARLGGISLG